jgi:hypothetical protein
MIINNCPNNKRYSPKRQAIIFLISDRNNNKLEYKDFETVLGL